MHTTSVTLLERLRLPADDAAWHRFVDLYTPLLFHWARKCGQQPDEAADLVQDVFATLIKKLPSFRYDSEQSFRAWLRTVTQNLWRDRLRAVATRPMYTVDDPAVDAIGSDPIAELAESEYRGHLIQRAMTLMQRDFEPTTWRAVLDHTIDGKPAAEVAKFHGLTVGAVYCAKCRVLSRLRQELDGLMD